MSNGLIIQWGVTTLSGSNADNNQSSNYITFPIAFTVCYQVVGTTSGGNVGSGYNNSVMVQTPSTTGCYIRKNFGENRNFRWIAIGK